MTRSIHASVVTELAKDDFNLCTLVNFGFSVGSPEAPIVLTDADFDVTYGGVTYLTSGHIQTISGVSENYAIRVGTLNIVLSAVEQTYVSLFLSTDHIDLRARYWKALLDDSYAVIGEPILMFDGRISGFKMSESATRSTLTVECASHWANFQTINGRKTNQNSQQIHFPSDLGFEFASHNVKDILWGRTQ